MQELILNGGYSKNDIYLQVLLHLMMHVVDTNVIARCGIEAMEYVKAPQEMYYLLEVPCHLRVKKNFSYG